MEKKRKLPKIKKKWAIPMGIAVLLGVGGVTVFAMKANTVKAVAQAVTQSTQVKTGTITQTVIGTGTLAADEAQEVEIPTGITIDKVKVASGDTVKKGDVLATVDSASVLAAMTEVQEEMDELDEEIEEAREESSTETITAHVSGRVKKIYGESGSAVADLMAEHGALVLLSTDGLMAVQLDGTVNAAQGDSVNVTLADGSTIVTGTVESVTGSSCAVTLTDNGTGLGEQVSVSDTGGNLLGSGTLYIHQPLEITAVAGTVSYFSVSENESVDGDSALLTLKDVPNTSYSQLLAERGNLSQKLQSLLVLSKTNTITAPYDGIVQEVNVSGGDESAHTSGTADSSSSGSSGTAGSGGNTGGAAQMSYVSFNAAAVETAAASGETAEGTETETEENTPVATAGDLEEMGLLPTAGAAEEQQGYVAGEDASRQEAVTVDAVDNLSVTSPVVGGRPQEAVAETEAYTGSISWTPSDATFQRDTLYSAVIQLRARDGYAFATSVSLSLSVQGAVISGITVDSQQEQNTLTFTASFPKTPAEEQGTSQEGGSSGTNGGKDSDTIGDADSGSGDGSLSGTSQNGSGQDGSGSTSQGGSLASGDTSQGGDSVSGSTSQSGASASGTTGSAGSTGTGSGSSDSGSSTDSTSSGSSTSSQVNTQTMTAFTVSSQENMLLSVNVDELDILSIAAGQEAAITLDALEEESFSGQITSIANSATNSGGVSKYAVEITVPRDEDMRVGMNGTATITINSAENILVIPMDAVQERGGKSFVYTVEDVETGGLSGETEITTGLSDGSQVEVTEGLDEGTEIYYNKISSSSDTQSGQMGMGDMGGMMPEGFGGQDGGQGGGKGGGQSPPDMGSGQRPDRN